MKECSTVYKTSWMTLVRQAKFSSDFDPYYGLNAETYLDEFSDGFEDNGEPDWNYPVDNGAVVGSEIEGQVAEGTVLIATAALMGNTCHPSTRHLSNAPFRPQAWPASTISTK